jgi:hypothetical protein
VVESVQEKKEQGFAKFAAKLSFTQKKKKR